MNQACQYHSKDLHILEAHIIFMEMKMNKVAVFLGLHILIIVNSEIVKSVERHAAVTVHVSCK